MWLYNVICNNYSIRSCRWIDTAADIIMTYSILFGKIIVLFDYNALPSSGRVARVYACWGAVRRIGVSFISCCNRARLPATSKTIVASPILMSLSLELLIAPRRAAVITWCKLGRGLRHFIEVYDWATADLRTMSCSKLSTFWSLKLLVWSARTTSENTPYSGKGWPCNAW